LTSAGQRGDTQRCRKLGIAAYLIKPILQTELLEAVLEALGSSESPEFVTQLSSLKETRPLRVLLAEDNVVNQRLAKRILERQGHTVVVAGDGSKALDALGQDRFDVVLMDVQMPVLDGVQATIAIRKRERLTGDHIPIIAMTAYAMTGDRERFLGSGMDSYISKPVHSEELLEAVHNVLQLVPAISTRPGTNA